MNASANTPDTVLGRTRVREGTGVFHSRAALDVAAGELLLMGFDRADVDVVAVLVAVEHKVAGPLLVTLRPGGAAGTPPGPVGPARRVTDTVSDVCHCRLA